MMRELIGSDLSRHVVRQVLTGYDIGSDSVMRGINWNDLDVLSDAGH